MNTSNITNYKPKYFAALLGVSVKILQRWEGTFHVLAYDSDGTPLEPCVFGILGIDAHRCVAHNGLGTGGGDNGIVAAVVVGMHNGAFGG